MSHRLHEISEALTALHTEIRTLPVPECVVTGGQWGVRPYQGDCSGYQQYNAAEGFDVKKTLQGGEGTFGQKLGTRQVLPCSGWVHGRSNSAWRPDQRINLFRHGMRLTPSTHFTKR